MTSKIRRVRYKRRLIMRPYSTFKRAKAIEKKISQAGNSEIEEQISSESPKAIDTIVNIEEKTVAQLSNELASFKVAEDPYAYFVSQLPHILNSIPNLLKDPKTQNDETDDSLIRKNGDVLQTAKQQMDGGSAQKYSGDTSTTMSAVPSDQQSGKTAHTYTYKMAAQALADCQISNSAAVPNESSASDGVPENSAESISIPAERRNEKTVQQKSSSEKISGSDKVSAQKQASINKHIGQRHLDWGQQIVTVTLEEGKYSDIFCPKQIFSSQNCSNSKTAEVGPLWITWKSKQNKSMQNWLFQLHPERRFLWPGLPEKSCRQIRFGGQKDSQITAQRMDADPAFLFYQLSALAELRKCSLLRLLLLLSPVESVRHFLGAQPLQDIARHCLTMPEISLSELTVSSYLIHLLRSDLLETNLACFTQILPSLVCADKTNLLADQLGAFFSHRLKHNSQGLFKLTMGELVIYIEALGEQVQIYNSKGEANVWRCSSFIEQLALSQFENKDVCCEAFNQPDRFHQQLVNKLLQAEQQWKPHWHRHLYEFIISPEVPGDATELPQ